MHNSRSVQIFMFFPDTHKPIKGGNWYYTHMLTLGKNATFICKVQ